MSRSIPGRVALHAAVILGLGLGAAAPGALGAPLPAPYLFTLPHDLHLVTVAVPGTAQAFGVLRIEPVPGVPAGALPGAIARALGGAEASLAKLGGKAEPFAEPTGSGVRFQVPGSQLAAALVALGEALAAPLPAPEEGALPWSRFQASESAQAGRFAAEAAGAAAGLWGSAWPVWGPAGAEPGQAALQAAADASFRPERVHLALTGAVSPATAPALAIQGFAKLLLKGEAPAPALPPPPPVTLAAPGYALGLPGPGGEDPAGFAALDVLAHTLDAPGGRLEQALSRSGASRDPGVRVLALEGPKGGVLALCAPAGIGEAAWGLHARAFEAALASLGTSPLTLAEWASAVDAVGDAADAALEGPARLAERLAAASALEGDARHALAYPEIVRQVSRQDVQAVLARAASDGRRFSVTP